MLTVWERILRCTLRRFGAIQVLRNADGGGESVTFSGEKRYEGVRFNVIISITRGCMGVHFTEKNCYVTLEWPLYCG